MPVRRANPDVSGVDPYRRLSASQVITWKTCPRLWYYSYIPKLKSPLPPQILRGNAVEECISRILRESPVYISSIDADLILSPLNPDGSVAYESDQNWVGPNLEPISKEGAGFLVILDRVVKLISYYLHERAWFSSNFGVVKKD